MAHSSGGFTVTAGAANVKGGWTEIVSSTADDYDGIMVSIWSPSVFRARWHVDLGWGPAGSEQVFAEDFMWANETREESVNQFGPFSIHIPAGTRLSVRGASTAASSTIRGQVQLIRTQAWRTGSPFNYIVALGPTNVPAGGLEVRSAQLATASWNPVHRTTEVSQVPLIYTGGLYGMYVYYDAWNNSVATQEQTDWSLGAMNEDLLQFWYNGPGPGEPPWMEGNSGTPDLWRWTRATMGLVRDQQLATSIVESFHPNIQPVPLAIDERNVVGVISPTTWLSSGPIGICIYGSTIGGRDDNG